MIPKATIQALAFADGVQPSTVEKDYALGWLLYGVAQHPGLSRWVFKGGTCLKKCFFETYRFSEDLDFTVPPGIELSVDTIRKQLEELCAWVAEETGIAFSTDRITVEQYTNPQGTESFTARVYYSGPLKMAQSQIQRVKFDITQHEVLVDAPQHRAVHHRYEDRIEPAPTVACYSVNEVLAEKSRALYERQGRARDVYDVVNINRNFRQQINAARAREILREKFKFKKLPEPSVDVILDRIDREGLASAWEQQLTHQLPILPPVETFVNDLRGALAWWIDGVQTEPTLAQAPLARGERVAPRALFGEPSMSNALGNSLGNSLSGSLAGRRHGYAAGGAALDRIRFAARNRLCVQVSYHDVLRVVEAYSLRIASTGKTNLFVYELQRDGLPTGQTKSFHVSEIESADVLMQPFSPRWLVEL